MSGFTLCSLVQSWNATSVVGTALTGLTLEALTTSASGTFPTSRDVRLKSGMQTKADVRQPP